MRRILALLFPLLLAFLLVSRGAEWWSEKWWFEALDQSATWWTYVQWRGGAFAIAAPLWLAIVGTNMRLAWRQSLALREPLSLLGGGFDEIPVQVTPALRVGRSVMVTTIWMSAWLAALAASNRFDLWLLFGQSARERSELSFFLFQLPALQWIVGWLGAAFGLTFAGCLTLYFWLEAIETGPGVLRASESARRHLALLGALLVAWKGADCALGAIASPIVYGESVNGILGVPEQWAGLPTLQLFAWSALPVAVLLFWLGARDQGRRAIVLGVGFVMLATVMPTIAPAFVRSLGVGNDALQSQAVARHLAGTRQAWGFETVENVEIKNQTAFADTILPAPGRAAPVVLWPLDGASNELSERLHREPPPPLRAARLHVAREGDALQLRAIATKRDDMGEAPARAWQAPPGAVGPLQWNAPFTLDDVLLSEAPPASEPQTNRLGPPPPAEGEPLAPTPPYRLTTQSRYAIERAWIGACLTLAWRFFDASLIAPGPPLMLHLDPVERARNLAPFVNWAGAVAHPVVQESGVGPHVYWIVEGCFTARTFPNAATLPGGDAWSGINYARQNVTAVFDGTSGESQLYLFNRSEPLARAWNRALPGLFRPIEEMPVPLRAAIVPSPAYLNAMSRLYARYHPDGGDESQNWATRASEWRPILAASAAPAPLWNAALLPTEQGELAQWQIGAFAPARGRVENGGSITALTGIAGVRIRPDGSWQWRQWRPSKPLSLPDIATPPQFTYNTETGAKFAPPTRVGVFPAFDAAGHPEGFTAFRAEVQAGENNAPATLRVQAETTGALAPGPQPDAPIASSLVRARELWNAILTARRTGDWPLVARLEEQLSRTLNVATPQTPTTPRTPTASQTPVASQTPATSQTPVAFKTPATLKTPVASKTPIVPRTPATFQTPVAFKTLTAPRTPATSKTP